MWGGWYFVSRYLSSNRITKFDAVFPNLIELYVDVLYYQSAMPVDYIYVVTDACWDVRDLSENNLTAIPAAIFQHKSLATLYV